MTLSLILVLLILVCGFRYRNNGILSAVLVCAVARGAVYACVQSLSKRKRCGAAVGRMV